MADIRKRPREDEEGIRKRPREEEEEDDERVRLMNSLQNKIQALFQLVGTIHVEDPPMMRVEDVEITTVHLPTHGSVTHEDQRTVVLDTVRVPGNVREHILQLMAGYLCDYPNKGKRFRENHHIELDDQDLIVHNQRVNASTSTKPKCIICSAVIEKGEHRCKLNIALHPIDPTDDCCSTHVYCLPCYVVLLSTVLPGHTPVCFGTCRTKRGGCRQRTKENDE
jgi:hypothetical protein